MAHKVSLYYPEAPLGRAEFYRQGTATLSTQVYSDAHGTSAVTTTTLGATGRAVRYVTEPVDVVVKTSAGAQVDTFTEITDARLVRVENAFATGPNAVGQTVAGGRTTAHALLTLLKDSFNDEDGYVNPNGTSFLLYQAIGSSTGVYYNVRSGYGAKGDFTNDDTSAIQAAINAAQDAGGGIVFFPPGTYKLTASLSVTSSVTLQGSGPSTTVLAQVTTGLSNGWLRLAAAGAVVRGLSIACSPTTITGSALEITSGGGASYIDSCGLASGAGACVTVGSMTSPVTLMGCTLTTQNVAGQWITGDNSVTPLALVGCDLNASAITTPTNPLISRSDIFRPLVTLIGGQVTGGAGGSQTLFSQVFVTMDGVTIYANNSSGTTAVLGDGADARMVGCYVAGLGGGGISVVGHAAAGLSESGCGFATGVVILAAGALFARSLTRDSRATTNAALSGTSYTPNVDFGVHVLTHTSGASMAFANPTLTTFAGGSPLTILYKNTTGGNITPTWGTAFSGVPATAVNNGNAALYEFRFAPQVGSGEWILVSTTVVTTAA